MATAADVAESARPVRVAILGGGAGALAAAYALTEAGGFDITVYQMGWRLGGKGASGRRLDDSSGRDEEHGLHVLGGFYHNAMGLLRSVYEVWGQTSKHPLAFDDAFIPQSRVHVIEEEGGASFPVRFPFPPNDRPLGQEPQELNLLTVAQAILSYIDDESRRGPRTPRGADYARDPAFLRPLASAIEAASAPSLLAMRGERHAGYAAYSVNLGGLNDALAITQAPRLLPPPPNAEQDPDYGILFEIGLVVAKGILMDGLWWKGFDAANGEEFTDWMVRHGLSRRALASAYFRCGYDYAFAYVEGDPARPMAAAGAGLRGFLRMVFTYNKAVFVHMRGGMGEIVFVPLYEVLRSRGVKFKFFHRVDALELDPSGRRLERVAGVVQNVPREVDYDPLLPYVPPDPEPVRWVWPSQPIEDRLQHRPTLPARPEFLYESPWRQPETSESFDLRQDLDFDLCVLGIPVGALHDICRDLAAKIPEWRRMLQASATTPTLAAQLWRSGGTAELGWPNGATVLTANKPPLSTWADMSYLLDLEQPSNSHHLSYFCGPVSAAIYQVSPYDSDIGPPELARGLAEATGWCRANLGGLLPEASPPTQLALGENGDEFYVRLNSFPSERYVLTVPGAVDRRLTPGGSFVENLYLAGDWTKNGYDLGSFETAVLSGLICARAITRRDVVFPGERDIVG